MKTCEKNLFNYNGTVIGASYSIIFPSELKLEIALKLEVGYPAFATFPQDGLRTVN